MAKGSMREEMPVVAAWIDDLRQTFGVEYINRIIRAGINGQPVFFVSENGHTIGTPMPEGVVASPASDGMPVNQREAAWDRQYRLAKEQADNDREQVAKVRAEAARMRRVHASARAMQNNFSEQRTGQGKTKCVK